MNVEQQIEWEAECLDRGSQRYYQNQEKMREHGQLEQTDVVSHLFRQRIREVGDYLEKQSVNRKGVNGAYNGLLARCVVDNDWGRVAYIGAQAAFHVVMIGTNNTIMKLCLTVGTRLEADLKCRMFEAKYPEYYHTVMKSFRDQNVSDYNHRHKVMMKKFNDFDLTWNDWRVEVKIHIGQRVVAALIEIFHDVLYVNMKWEKGKSTSTLDTTAEFDTWAKEFEKERGFMFPMLLPLKVPPKQWELDGSTSGGYYTPRLMAALPFIKTKGKDHKAWVRQHPAEGHRRAVNSLQKTAWCINEDVRQVQRQIYIRGLAIGMPSNVPLKPPAFPEHLENIKKALLTEQQQAEITDWKMLAKTAYGNEQQRKGQVLAFMQVQKLAEELSTWPEFYFAYNCDFRGRIYCATSGLTPQGADTAKGLLRFKEGVVLGASGLRWLAIHGANTFGVDKVPYDDRVKWVKDNKVFIQQVVEDPISYRSFWGNADKPYQFLAFCFEWARTDYGNNDQVLGYLPVGLDGSCNGLQHYSAMLRDPVGAKATNLCPTDRPQDIYQEVANVTIAKLKLMDDPRARKWLQVGVTRSCAKRPVMTLPYGATQSSARMYVLEYVIDNWAKFELEEKHRWEFANFLTPILWESISEVVVAAREGMDWLRGNVGNNFVKWVTPVGFPVYQFYKDMVLDRVKSQISGVLRLCYVNMDGSNIAKPALQRSGVAPNFVHSMDSTHLVMTVNRVDLPAYAMIHDDFGTHAGNIHKLFPAIRESFYELYSKHDPLKDWAFHNNVTTPPPKLGTYNLEDIINADYFFG
jgi:DNA-directed RNA polymerase